MSTPKKTTSIDKRTVDRYLEKGVLSKQEVQEHIKRLPDDAPNAVWVQNDIHEADLTMSSDDEGGA